MPLVDDIKALHERQDLDEDDKRQHIYKIKTGALRGAIQPIVGRVVEQQGFSFQINKVEITPDDRLFLDVTFIKPPAEPVTHQIFITNPPLLPRNRTGNEKEDLLAAVSEMLEGFV